MRRTCGSMRALPPMLKVSTPNARKGRKPAPNTRSVSARSSATIYSSRPILLPSVKPSRLFVQSDLSDLRDRHVDDLIGVHPLHLTDRADARQHLGRFNVVLLLVEKLEPRQSGSGVDRSVDRCS